MAAPTSCHCALSTRISIPMKPPPRILPFPSFARDFVESKACGFKVNAELGGEGEVQKGEGKKNKFITKEEELEQYWQTSGERAGENPLMTPLPYIIIFGMFM